MEEGEVRVEEDWQKKPEGCLPLAGWGNPFALLLVLLGMQTGFLFLLKGSAEESKAVLKRID